MHADNDYADDARARYSRAAVVARYSLPKFTCASLAARRAILWTKCNLIASFARQANDSRPGLVEWRQFRLIMLMVALRPI